MHSKKPSLRGNLPSALFVSALNPISLVTLGVASGVNLVRRKCLMFRCSISLSMVGPSVIIRYILDQFLCLVSVLVSMIFLLDNSSSLVVQTSFVSYPSPVGRFVLLFLHPFLDSLLRTLLLLRRLWMFSLFFVL
jgi:hypothetical protein